MNKCNLVFPVSMECPSAAATTIKKNQMVIVKLTDSPSEIDRKPPISVEFTSLAAFLNLLKR